MQELSWTMGKDAEIGDGSSAETGQGLSRKLSQKKRTGITPRQKSKAHPNRSQGEGLGRFFTYAAKEAIAMNTGGNRKTIKGGNSQQGGDQ